MTGYGRGEAANENITTVVEIRTVNNRFRDIQIRVPKSYLSLEPRIRKAISKVIHRGRIEIFVHRESVESSQQISCDPILAERYLKAMQAVAKRLQRDQTEIALHTILAQPGVLLTTEPEPNANYEWDLIATALDLAIADLCNMRKEEGEALHQNLLEQLLQLQQIRHTIEQQFDDLTKHLQQKLEQRLIRLLGDKIEPIRLAQEAAILVDKSDISEELTRLQSHCDQLQNIFNTPGPVGRKIDFILQEFNREINTIGSKSSSHKVAMSVLEFKSILEKIREQAANIE